jgi:ubiquitin-protein ligase
MAMDGIGLAIGVVGLAGLFKTALEAWEFIEAGRAHAESFSFFRTRLDNQRVIFLIWAETLGFFQPEGYNKALDEPQRRAAQIEQTLTHIAHLFSNTDQLVDEYGFKISRGASESSSSSGAASSTIFHNKYVRLRTILKDQRETRGLLADFRAALQRQQSATGLWKKFKWSIRDEKKSSFFLDKISSLVDDLDKLTKDIDTTVTKNELAFEAVAEVSETSLVEIEESSGERATIISSAASLRLRSIEGRTIATATTDTATFVTAETNPESHLDLSQPGQQALAVKMDSDHMAPLDLRALVEANRQSAAAIVAAHPNGSSTGLGPNRKRILREIGDWAKGTEADDWFTISVIHDIDLRNYLGTFRGPGGTPYEGGIFHVRMSIDFERSDPQSIDTESRAVKPRQEYPWGPPAAWFVTKILHPNIDRNGAICLDILEEDGWSLAMKIEHVLVSIASLLSSPNWEEPVDGAIPVELLGHPDKFDECARAWTKKYATGHIVYPGEREDGFTTVCEVP